MLLLIHLLYYVLLIHNMVQQKVDLLMNKINALTKTVTNEQVLKSTSIDLSDDS